MRPEGKLPCILLAAGASSRMGSHKLLLSIDGEKVVRRTASVVLARCYPLIVVTGYGREAVEEALAGLEGIIFAYNGDWDSGRVSSAIRGLEALPAASPGFFLHHADMPFISEAAFDALEGRIRDRGETASGLADMVLVAGHRGKPGHPVYFPSSCIPAIRALEKGESLRSVLDDRGFLIVETGGEGVLDDLDNPGDYAALCRKYSIADGIANGRTL
ncbi:MAG: NTP transferase domain-containing protein [Rectinemataceae bacterium]